MIRVLFLAIALASAGAVAAPSEPSPPKAAGVPVVMYTTAWCPYCAKARAYFKSNGIAYVEHDIEASESAIAEFKRLHGRVVPLIFVGRERIDGFNELSFEFALQKASR